MTDTKKSSKREILESLRKLRDNSKPLAKHVPLAPKGSTTINEEGTAYVTTTPLGVRLAWDDCARCYAHVLSCECPSGPKPPRSVEYCYDKDRALSLGQEWSVNHPNYRGTFPKSAPTRKAKSDAPKDEAPKKRIKKRKTLTKSKTLKGRKHL